jgi:hypothetical protein
VSVADVIKLRIRSEEDPVKMKGFDEEAIVAY